MTSLIMVIRLHNHIHYEKYTNYIHDQLFFNYVNYSIFKNLYLNILHFNYANYNRYASDKSYTCTSSASKIYLGEIWHRTAFYLPLAP